MSIANSGRYYNEQEGFDFVLAPEELTTIAALNKNIRYYTSTPELLNAYAQMIPPVDEQK